MTITRPRVAGGHKKEPGKGVWEQRISAPIWPYLCRDSKPGTGEGLTMNPLLRNTLDLKYWIDLVSPPQMCITNVERQW